MSTRKVKDAKDLESNELIYFKGHAKATYMSNGKTVEDAINEVSSGGGGGSASGGSVSIPIIEHAENDTVVTIEPNTYHKWGDVDNLTIDLGEGKSGVLNEYMFSFINNNLAPRITLPELNWKYGDSPIFTFFARNVVKIADGCASVESYSLAKIVLEEEYGYGPGEQSWAISLFNTIMEDDILPGEYSVGDAAIYVYYYSEYNDTVIDDRVAFVRIPLEDGYPILVTEGGYLFELYNDGSISFFDKL